MTQGMSTVQQFEQLFHKKTMQPIRKPSLKMLNFVIENIEKSRGGAEHSEISRSREISRDLDSFFLTRPRDFERKYLALVSNSEMFRQKSRSRLEL